MSDGYGNDWDGLPLFGGDTPPFKPGATRKEQIQDMVGFVKQATEAYAKRSDPETAHIAAQYVREELPQLEQVVLTAFMDAGGDGLTGDELSRATGIFRHTCCPRIAPLCRKGFIVDSGERRTGRSNRKQVVWKTV